MDEIFARRQLDANGNISDQYAITEEFLAMLDLYLAASFSELSLPVLTISVSWWSSIQRGIQCTS